MDATSSPRSVMWKPSALAIAGSHLARFIDARRQDGADLPPAADPGAFAALHAWSIAEPEAFWSAVWHDAEVIAIVSRTGRLG